MLRAFCARLDISPAAVGETIGEFEIIPADDGDGSTSTEPELEPGEHTLCL